MIAKKLTSLTIASLLLFQTVPLGLGGASIAAAAREDISNASLSAKIGELGQIEELYINNNPANRNGQPINFVLPNNTSPQNDVQHQWMGEMIFSYRTGDSEQFPNNRDGFVEVDTNKTLAAGGSTTYSNISPTNPYIQKSASSDGKKVEVNFIGQELDSTVQRAMKGFDVKSVFDMDTEDGSMLWNITVKNKSSKYMEFGDIGLPMPWNNKYRDVLDTYDNRLTVHNFAGADSGYAYAIRTSGEGNFMLFTPVPESGARIEYVDYWHNDAGELRTGSTFSNWTGDSGGWFPGLNVLYIHSKDIQKTGRGYFTDASSLVLGPNEEKTYQFKFSAVRAGNNEPQDNAQSPNNASTSMEDREANLRSILYQSGMIDAVAVPGFQTAINMPTKLDLHYNDSLIDVQSVEIQSVHENDPFDEAHIPSIKPGKTREEMVNNSRAGRGLPDGNPGYTESAQFVETKIINGEQHHIYSLQFNNIGNNSVRVKYKLKVGDEWVDKFTQLEFNVLAELDATSQAHSTFMVERTQDTDPNSPTYGIYRDWYLTGGIDMDKNHWGDDWSHDNINFMAMKNYLDPNPNEIRSMETYLIDFMWKRFMKNTQDSYTVSNYLRDSGSFTDKEKPYTRAFSEIMVATGYFNMYRVQKAYPNLIEYRESPQYYLEKAYGIYYNRISSEPIGFYGEQQIPDMIEALKEEGMQTEAQRLQQKFARDKGRNVTRAVYPFGSEFEYDNTGEEGAYSAAKALRSYYPGDERAAAAKKSMQMSDWKTRAMRGIQPTWYHYSVPVFRAGESWWNFQYTASLAGYIMDDWLRYQEDGRSGEQQAIAQQRNYAAKISNFNAVNMGQIAAQSVGSTSWRYSMHKGGTGTKDVFDGGSRVMNNGWNDFSGESEEGLYGSLLSISSDIVTDPVFGLFGYGALVTDEGNRYAITPKDGFGKRLNLINEKIYLVLENDKIEHATIQKDGKALTMEIANLAQNEHASKIKMDGAGVENGYYTIKLNGTDAGQFYVQNNKGVAMFQMSSAPTAQLTIEKAASGENQAPKVTIQTATQAPQALIPFMLNGMVTDDGAPSGTLTYQWEVVSTPQGGKLSFVHPQANMTQAVGTKEGSYTVKLTANDGEEQGAYELTFTLAAAPDKQPPVIGAVTAVQDDTNNSILLLSGEATADPVHSAEFEPTWTYQWTVKQKPDGVGEIAFVDGDKATAYARVSKAGRYVFTFTAADEGKAASKDVTIEIQQDAKDTYRAISVVTQKSIAPLLPAATDILYDDGYRTSEIEWNAVEPSSYANIGQFEVSGRIKGSELEVHATVYVVDTELQNAALVAKPSASFSSGDGYPEAMNNGFDPKSSGDFSPNRNAPNSAWHNWGREGDPAWVMYEWPQPLLASAMDVYVFQDGAGNFRPKDMQLMLRDEHGTWYTPRALHGLGNELNQYNKTTFEPAYITGVRMDMKPIASGLGILEWKVYGYTGAVDKSELIKVYNYATTLNPDNFIDQGLAPIEEAKATASDVIKKLDATEEEAAEALNKLLNDLRLLHPRDNNAAFLASVSASYTSPWESLAAINDGKKATSSIPHWGTWGNGSAAEWVQYDWPQGATINSTDLILWTDGGGILVPAKYEYSYIPMDSPTNEWVTLGAVSEGITLAVGTPVGSSNPYEFAQPLKVKSLRVTITKQQADGNGVGLWEWEVFQGQSTQEREAPTTPSGVAPTNVNRNDGKLIGVTAEMEYRKEGTEQYTAITGTEVTDLAAGTYYVRYMKAGSWNASPDKEVIIPEGVKQDQETPDHSGWTITNANTDTDTKGKIEGVNDTMEYRKLGDEDYIPVSGTSMDNLEPGSYQIRYAETGERKASEPVTVVIGNEAKIDRDAPKADELVITPPTAAGGNDGKIEQVTAAMEYRKVDGGAYMPITGTSIDNLAAGRYEIRYAETDTENPSPAIVIVVPDGAKQEQNPPSDAAVKGVNVTASGAVDGRITGVDVTMEYQKQGAASDDWVAITGTEVTGLGIGTYYVRYKETTTRLASSSLTITISNPADPEPSKDTEAPKWSVGSRVTAQAGTTFVTLSWDAAAAIDTVGVTAYKVAWKQGAETKTQDIADGKATSTAIRGLQPGTSYTFKLEAGDAAGNWSKDGPSVTVTTVQSSYYPSVSTQPEPEQPVKPEQPVDPVQPVDPEQPVEPEQPAEPEQPEQPKIEFKDVPATYWAAQEIERAVGLGIVNGYGDQQFKPNAATTRAEFITMLAKAFQWQAESSEQGELTFSDHGKIGTWAKAAITQGIAHGVITGYADGSFRPDQEITRTEMMVMLARAMELPGSTAQPTSFADDAAIPAWGKGAVEALRELGVVTGRNNNSFAPNDAATRAEALVIIMRILDRNEA
ncbi:S-layer homology domain-containing protein [Paenibacillus sp. SYP-B4298]|uniref:S-layer homology domain-containing protein n=1 Tax=Paenibacillus sp. SYP-B4298 TaxID=2996034 RepID=UPI0022DE8E82|nr:S-layer homology domain-containing protein [Paenibacillus sp. SYP-B4298]